MVMVVVMVVMMRSVQFEKWQGTENNKKSPKEKESDSRVKQKGGKEKKNVLPVSTSSLIYYTLATLNRIIKWNKMRLILNGIRTSVRLEV